MKKDKNFLEVGKILKPNGIRGELKVQPLTDLPADLSKVKEVRINGKMFTVDSMRVTGDFCYLHLVSIDDRNGAEDLRDAVIEASRDMLPPLKEGRRYIADLIGLKVVSNGEVIGQVSDVLQYGSADIYEIKAQKSFMFPAVEGVIESVNTESGELIVNDSELEKVAVYED